MIDYFGNDEYWKEHIHKNLEEDMWIEEYKDYLNSFDIIKIDERETIRVNYKKNYIVFIAKKDRK